MAAASTQEITQLLRAWGGGDQTALEELTRLCYEELRRIARRHMRREQSGHTLQASALVNEAYLRLADWKNVEWQSRAHFFAMAARVMRNILVDFARKRGRAKRGADPLLVSLSAAAHVSRERESPDGRFVYYAKENVPGLWRVPAEGGEEMKVSDEVRQGAWAVWGRGVYFLNPEARPHLSIEFYSFADGRTTPVATIEKELFWSGPGLTATPDGRWILYAQNDQTESDIMLVENFS